jgi:hypothetical protein
MEDNLINFEPGVIKGFNFNKKNIKVLDQAVFFISLVFSNLTI